MGRSAGWLAYGAAIAGEASLVISVEDIIGELPRRRRRHRPEDRRTPDARSHERRRGRRPASSRRCSPARPRARSSASSCWPRGSPSTCPCSTWKASRATSTGTSRISHVNLGRHVRQAGQRRIQEADRQAAARSPACSSATRRAAPAARLRRHARQPARRRRLPGPGRRRAQRRDGLGHPASSTCTTCRSRSWSIPRRSSPSSATSRPAATSTGWPGSWRRTSTNRSDQWAKHDRIVDRRLPIAGAVEPECGGKNGRGHRRAAGDDDDRACPGGRGRKRCRAVRLRRPERAGRLDAGRKGGAGRRTRRRPDAGLRPRQFAR